MEIENVIIQSKENTIFLKIDIKFKDSFGKLELPNPEIIQVTESIYTLSIDTKTNHLQISGVFTCTAFPKAFKAFNEIEKDKLICIDTEPNLKLKNFFDENYYKCIGEIERLFKLLRWKYELGKGEIKYADEQLFWSFDKKDWKPFVTCPAAENLTITVNYEQSLDAEMIRLLMENGDSEPIFNDLLRQANTISQTNLKSAFVIAVSALEVAVKYCVKSYIPEAEWLIEELPSPPTERIVTEFFPKLIPGLILPTDISKTLKSIVSIRNDLVHKGQTHADRLSLFEKLNFINDFILHKINQICDNNVIRQNKATTKVINEKS